MLYLAYRSTYASVIIKRSKKMLYEVLQKNADAIVLYSGYLSQIIYAALIVACIWSLITFKRQGA